MTIAEQWETDEKAQAIAAAMMAAWGFSQEETLEARARALELVEPEPDVMLVAVDLIEKFLTRGNSIGSTVAPDQRTSELAEACANYVIALNWAQQGIVHHRRPVTLIARLEVDMGRMTSVTVAEEEFLRKQLRNWEFSDDEIESALDMMTRRAPIPPQVLRAVNGLVRKSWDLEGNQAGLIVGAMRTQDMQDVRRAEVLANCIATLAAFRSGVKLPEPPFVILAKWPAS